eukprot:12934008-Prorocentrum_lima.AAC.1
MSRLPPPLVSSEDVRGCFQLSSGGYDQRTGVYMLLGHVGCSWEHTLKNVHNQQTFKGYSWDSLNRKGVYPLNSNS